MMPSPQQLSSRVIERLDGEIARAEDVLEREFHASQSVETTGDGRVILRMKVVVDWGLTAWVMGFGPRARVLTPRRLAQQVFEQVEEMRDIYAPKIPLDVPPAKKLSAGQGGLPFRK